jgi:ABC-type multidrug transport system permease subunit
MDQENQSHSARTLPPTVELTLARLREAYRRPETLFWVYIFPILMVVALGIAFKSKPVEKFYVDVQASEAARQVMNTLAKDKRFELRESDAETSRSRLRVGKTDVVVIPKESRSYEFRYDPTQPRSMLARNTVNEQLQRAAGRKDPASVKDTELNEPGGRYIDFLVPGLLGMSLMSGGLWGVGFAIVDMRIRKLLKRFIATPMKKRDFLAAVMISRLFFLAPEMVLLLVFSRIAFGVVNYGSWLSVAVLILLGAATFAGLGLLVATRAQSLEAASGLMNLVMLPMWILSGIFFSPDRFPAFLQPLVHALPLTGLIGALRRVMLEGASLPDVWQEIALLFAWMIGSFVLALKFFKWS